MTIDTESIAQFLKNVSTDVSLVVIATGDVEHIVMEMGQTVLRPKRLLVMDTNIRVGYGLPKNSLDENIFVAQGMETFKSCTIEPTTHNFGLGSLARLTVTSTITSLELERLFMNHYNISKNARGAMFMKCLGAIVIVTSLDTGDGVGHMLPAIMDPQASVALHTENHMDMSQVWYAPNIMTGFSKTGSVALFFWGLYINYAIISN